jgi:hypothetical protein
MNNDEKKYDYIEEECFDTYMKGLIGDFYKILPIFENEPDTYKSHLDSFLIELKGVYCLVKKIHYDRNFMKLIATVQYLTENECDHKRVKKEVFKCTSILEKLKTKYGHFER